MRRNFAHRYSVAHRQGWFSGGLTLRPLLRAGVPFVGWMRSRVKVRPADPEAVWPVDPVLGREVER